MSHLLGMLPSMVLTVSKVPDAFVAKRNLVGSAVQVGPFFATSDGTTYCTGGIPILFCDENNDSNRTHH